ncbi:MAG: dihydroorotate dehydrogenase [Actinobacteria bacterium]|nr:dihydroorotate dehydrogenase [Actinomycetota bacterium]
MSRRTPTVDLSTAIGTVRLPNPVCTASGTAGHGDELARHLDPSALGAMVVKSLHAEPWPGNPSPRVHATPAGMINSVGLQGPGVEAWLDHDLPPLLATGARVVASIWGRTVEEFARAAELLTGAPSGVVAVEVNASCPNLEDRRNLFAHSAAAVAEVVDAAAAAGRPLWVKLSPNTPDLPDIAGAAAAAGAEAVTVANTLLGMVIDVETRRPLLGAGRGGLSGPAIRPVAVRAVFDTHEAHPTLPIIGVGGIAAAEDAVQFLLAGASAVQVGTATFADPAAPARVLADLGRWCDRHGVRSVSELVGAAHGREVDG